jgi:DNA repair protein RadD
VSLSLRPYQSSAIEQVLELKERGVRRVLLVLPTGAGKTVIASALIRQWVEEYTSVLFLSHRREIIKQSFAKLVRGGLSPSQAGIVMAGTSWKLVDDIAAPPDELDDDELWKLYGRTRPNAMVQVGSIDTFRNQRRPKAGVVVIDEAHRATAKSYCDVQLAYPDAFHLGLTATPIGPNGKPLRPAYDEMVVGCTFSDLVELGSLIEPTCYGLPPDKRADLSSVKVSGGDYKVNELAQLVDKAELVGDIVEHWKRLGNDAPTFCFAVNVAHSKHLAERFNAAGIPARHVDGGTDTTERDEAIAALREGRVKVLCNCDCFCEGTDVTVVKTIILARPTKSIRLYLQQVGRGARPDGDTPFTVLDHAGCCRDPREGGFGLPQRERIWSLDGPPKLKGNPRLAAQKDCPGCWALVPVATRRCPCGYEFPFVETSNDPPEELDGELVKLNEAKQAKKLAALDEKERKALDHWNEIVGRWRAMNEERDREGLPFKAGGWCINQWRKETGRMWPPKGSIVVSLTPEQRAANELRKRQNIPPGVQVSIDPGRPWDDLDELANKVGLVRADGTTSTGRTDWLLKQALERWEI